MIRELAQLYGHDDQDERLATWMQREDGSWWEVDDYGIAHPVGTGHDDEFAEIDAAAQAALAAIAPPHVVDVAPLSVIDTEVDQ
ncbi:hypothetical protein [Nocardia pneumoniae]|uniref:hypothetical protein n=1 Tax=Nocardia pneumoniae TaxID=228601 RepID=UPI00031A545C|nr:hypothetical protein [Nocardia pneumoniae]